MPSSDQLWGEDLELDAPTLALLSQLDPPPSSTSTASSSSHATRMAHINSVPAPGPSSPSNSSLSQLTRPERTNRLLSHALPVAPPSPPAPLPSGPFMTAVLRSTSYNPIPNAHLLAGAGPSIDSRSSSTASGLSSSSSRTLSPELLQLAPPPAPKLEHPRPSLSPAALPGRIKRSRLKREASSEEEEKKETSVASGSSSNSRQPFLPSLAVASTSTSSVPPNLPPILARSSSSTHSTPSSTLEKGKGRAQPSPPFIPNPFASTSSSFSSSSVLLLPKPEPSSITDDHNLLVSNSKHSSQHSNGSPSSSSSKDKGKGKERASPLFSEDDFECSICQDLTVGTSSVVPCGHTFCGGCIWDYLKAGNSTCPICRASISSYGTRIIPNYVAENLLNKWAEGTLGEEEKKEWVSRKDGWLAYKLSLEDDPSFNPSAASRPTAPIRPFPRPPLPRMFAGGGAPLGFRVGAGTGAGRREEGEAQAAVRQAHHAHGDALRAMVERRRRRGREESSSEEEERGDGDYRPPSGDGGGGGERSRGSGRGFGSLVEGRWDDEEEFPPLRAAAAVGGSGSGSASRSSARRIRLPDSPPPPPAHAHASGSRPSASSSSSRSRAVPPPPPPFANPNPASSLRYSRPILPIPRRQDASTSSRTAEGSSRDLSPRARRRLAVLGPESSSDSDGPLDSLFDVVGPPPPAPRPSSWNRVHAASIPAAGPPTFGSSSSSSASRPSNTTSRSAVNPPARNNVWAGFSGGGSGSASGSGTGSLVRTRAEPPRAGGSGSGGGGGFAMYGTGASGFAAAAPLQRRAPVRRSGDSGIEVVDLISD